MKTIAFHINTLCRGGAERVVSNLANRFAKEGYNVYIATEWYDENEYSLDARVKRVHVGLKDGDERKSRITKFILRVKYLRKFAKEYSPDVLVSFAHRANYRALMALKNTTIPVVISVRANPTKLYGALSDKIQIKWLFPKAAGAVFQTEDQRRFFAPHLQDNSEIIINPVNEQYLMSTRQSSPDKVVVQHARLVDCKNQAMLCNAFIKVHGKHPDYSLRIYGGDSGDGTKELLDNIISKNEAKDYIHIMGESEAPEKALAKAEIYAFTSNNEGMPNAVLEAMVMGMPVISTDCPCGGPRELINNGVNGLLVPVGDEKALENSINYLIENKENANRMGECATRIRNIANEDAIFKKWETYLNKVVNSQ